MRLALATSLAIVLFAAPALAQSVDELKERGNQAMQQTNFGEALAAYKAALAKSPSEVTLHYNIGRAEQGLANYPAALDAYLAFEKNAPAETRAKVPGLAQLIADVRSRVAEVAVRCSVATTGTVVAGEARSEGCGPTPRTLRVSVPSKTAEIEIHLDSPTFRGDAVKVTVSGGAPPSDVLLTVSPVATMGFLRIVATPANAMIAVDGTARGNSPVELEAAPGSHTVDVSADAYEKRRLPVVVELGQRKDLSVSLEKTPSITKRWWFWTGAGIVAAGIVTTVVILAVQPEKSASSGSIDPGQVRAPLITF